MGANYGLVPPVVPDETSSIHDTDLDVRCSNMAASDHPPPVSEWVAPSRMSTVALGKELMCSSNRSIRLSESLVPWKKRSGMITCGKVGHPQRFGLARRVQRIGVEDDARRGIPLGDEIGGHSPPHRPPGQEQQVDLGRQHVGGRPVALDETLRPVRALRPPLGVGVVESEDSKPGARQTVAKANHDPVILVGARTVGQKQPVLAVTDETPTHLAARPLNSDN